MVLFFAVERPAVAFDPQIVSDTTASIVVRNCFEGLLRKDENGKIINGVAENYSISRDNLTYTFNLRQDSVWHLTSNAKNQAAGKIPENFDLSVTAHDFVFALKRGVDPQTNSHMAYMLYNISGAPEIMSGKADINTLGVKAVDRYTLEIKLNRPQSNFTEILCEPICMPCNEIFFNSCSGRYGTLIKFSLSNGPFYLSRFYESSCRINKAADYCGDSPALPDAVWLYCEENKKIIEELENNELSGAALDQNTYEQLKISKNMTVIQTPNVIRGFIMNLKDEILANGDIRKALSSATDTLLVAKNSGKTAVKGFVPSSAASAKVASHPNPYNEEKAVVYLANGLKTLGKENISITLLCETAYEDSIRRLFQEWQRIFGINVNFSVKTASFAEIEKAVASGNFQAAFCPISAQTDSAYEYFGTFSTISSHNITSCELSGIEEMTAKLYAGNDEDFVKQYTIIENELSAASVIIPVWEENTYMVCTKNISGVMFFSGSDKLYFHNANNKK